MPKQVKPEKVVPKVEEEEEEEESEEDSDDSSDNSSGDCSEGSSDDSSDSSDDSSDDSDEEMEEDKNIVKKKGEQPAKVDNKGKKKEEETKGMKHKRSDEESSRETAQQPERKKVKQEEINGKDKGKVNGKVNEKVNEKENGKSNGKSNGKVNGNSAPSAEVKKWREANYLTVVNIEDNTENSSPPFYQFSDAAFPEYINKSVSAFSFKTPTAIQAQTWPLALNGRDLVGIAETGSGKTLAFGYPAIIRIKNRKLLKKGPKALVLAPTRELAQQIQEVMKKACDIAGLRSACVFGGMPKQPQVEEMKSADIVIATPGRLIDLLQGGASLEQVDYLVFDEADRMLDMGFIPQIRQIVECIPEVKTRQTLMYSATWPVDVQKFAQTYLNSPIQITVGGEKLTGAKKVTQIVEVCSSEREKRPRLKRLLSQLCGSDKPRILIFMLYKKTCDGLYQELCAAKWNVACLHGDMTQPGRDKAVTNFKNGSCNILVATDVAARGLDIKDVKYVINGEMPLVMEDYIHRIGRTGRAGETGTAYTLFAPEDKIHARQLVRILEEGSHAVPPELAKIAETAPVTKPRRSTMEQLYGDYAKGIDADMMMKKPTKITFD